MARIPLPPEYEDEDEDVDEVAEVDAPEPTVQFEKPPVPAAPVASAPPRWATASTPVTPSMASGPTNIPPAPPPPVVRPAPTGPPPKEPKDRGGALKVVAVIAAIALVVIVAIVVILSLTGGDEGGVKYSDLKAGQCFESPKGRFNNVKTVPCTEQHELEVYAVLDHPAGPNEPFPGMDELVRYANPLCLAQFRAYAGVPFEQLSLSDKYITPRDSAWKDGARRIVCVVGQSNDESTNKSIKAGS